MHKMHVNINLSFVTIEYTQIYYKKLKCLKTHTHTHTYRPLQWKGCFAMERDVNQHEGSLVSQVITASI